MRAVRASVSRGWVLLLLAGCASSSQTPPEAGYQRGGVPQLEGLEIAVLPVQMREGGHPEIDREIEFALSQAGPDVGWIFADELRAAQQRNPGTRLQISNLQVRPFLAGELQRVGDPLFGDLYRLGAVTGASYGLLPVLARDRTGADGTAVEISAALVDLRSGNVLWYGIVDGSHGAPGDLSASAEAADALARTLLP